MYMCLRVIFTAGIYELSTWESIYLTLDSSTSDEGINIDDDLIS